ncbi:hypothetical protein ACHAWF_001216, partial [Thalassiosira exigua]
MLVNLKTDRAKEFVERMTDFMKLVKKRHIKMTYAEPERKNQITRVDSEIRDLKRRWHDKMRKKNAPERLWDYGLIHASKIMQILPRSQLRDMTALEAVTGKTPDISEFYGFDLYDLVWYHAGFHPGVGEQSREVGRWLGVSEYVGSDMCYWILSNNGRVIAETTVQHVVQDDLLNPTLKKLVDDFNERMERRLDKANFKIDAPNALQDMEPTQGDGAYGDNTPTAEEYGSCFDEVALAEDEEEIPAALYDKYVGAKVFLNEGHAMGGTSAMVTRRMTDRNGRPIGKAHSNPMLDTRVYEVQLEDGTHDHL